MALVLDPTHARVILHGITWATFERLLSDRGDNASPRLAYDQGTVELTMPSPEHEWLKSTLTQIVDAIAFARDLHYQNLASTTFTRQDLDRGFESDACFYIQHAAALQDIEHLDLATDPPPDLVIEIDITRPSLDKLSLYAAIRVPEVWRYTRDGIQLYHLQGDRYESIVSSVILPEISQDDLEEFVDQSRETTHRTAWFKDVVSRSQLPAE